MKFIQFLKSKTFRKHLGIAILSIAAILLIVFKGLDIYTKHGESVTVPDIRNLPTEEATRVLENQNFRYVIDSTYSDKLPGGTVLEQDPEAGAQVKEYRTIYLTIVSGAAPTVKLPDLIDVSFREAKAIIESYGLRVGQLIYQPDLAQNAVLGIKYNGESIDKGYQLPKGSVVDLILGDGFGNTKVKIPNLIGLSLEEAIFVLQGSKLIIGAVIFEGPIKDSSNTRVYMQSPEFSTDSSLSSISQGEAIDIYLHQE